MKSSLLWGIICLVILSTATIQLSDDVTSRQFKTLIFFTLLFILYYLTLAIGLIRTGKLRLSGFFSLGLLIFLGLAYIISSYEFTYLMYPIIIIALLLYLASGIIFIIALKDYLQTSIRKNNKLNNYKTQIGISLIICASLIPILAKLSFMKNSAIAISIFAGFLLLLYVFSENRFDYNGRIIVLTICFIISVVSLNSNTPGDDMTEKREYILISLIILALSWGWSSNRIIKHFFGNNGGITSYFVILAFAFAALGFYQVLIMQKGLTQAWKDIISYQNILLLIGICIGWIIAFESEKKAAIKHISAFGQP